MKSRVWSLQIAGAGANSVLRGVRCPGHHAICMPLIDHHGTVIGNIFHKVPGRGRIHILVLAKLVKGIGVLGGIRRIHRVYDLYLVQIKVNTQQIHFLSDFSYISQQGNIYYLYLYQVSVALKILLVGTLGRMDAICAWIAPFSTNYIETSWK